jgi:hypothetical protein
MIIKLTRNQYYYALHLAQMELLTQKEQQESLTKLAKSLYNAYEIELNRIAPDRKALILKELIQMKYS